MKTYTRIVLTLLVASFILVFAGGCKTKQPGTKVELVDIKLVGDDYSAPPPPPPPAEKRTLYDGTIKDFNKLEGCKWIIELDNGTKINPGSSLVIRPRDGMRVRVDYKRLPNVYKACMDIDVVEVNYLEEIK